MSDAIKFTSSPDDLASMVEIFERDLPGWWWSVGQCSVGAHASCGVDRQGVQKHLLDGSKRGDPYGEGFHCDTSGGQPHEALADVYDQAMDYLESNQ